jgi:hypothetical protein
MFLELGKSLVQKHHPVILTSTEHMIKDIDVSNTNKILKDYSGKRISSNEVVIYDFLQGDIDEAVTDKYVITNNCVYGFKRGVRIFLFYKDRNNIFYRFAENNKNFTKKILPLIGDNMTLYLMHREITYPKVRKDIFNSIDKYDMLHAMIYLYIEEDYYQTLNDSGYDFMDILFNQIKMFDAEEEMFSEKLRKNIDRWLKPKIHSDYDNYATTWNTSVEFPMVYVKDPYLDLKTESLKRIYKINSLIS